MPRPDPFSDYTVKWATSAWERAQALALRRRVFCDEQHLFEASDLDGTDARAQVLVALGGHGGWHDRVVGTVRIHPEAVPGRPHAWFGSRLAVDPDFRQQGQLGATLIRLAVSSARGLGCQHFFANVQAQNEKLFKRLHWHTLERRTLRGLEHAHMQADLAHYPPCLTPASGFVVRARKLPAYDCSCAAIEGGAHRADPRSLLPAQALAS